MSYILEALRKAERERDLGQAPNLKTDHGSAEPSTRRRLWPWWLVLALLINAGIIAWVFLSNNVPTVSTPKAVPSAPQTTAQPSTVSKREPVVSKPTSPPPAVHSKSSAPKQAVSIPVPAPRISPIPKNRPASPVTPDPSSKAPPLPTLSADFRQSMAALNLDVHVYSDQREKRFVMINSRRYREGEPLREGPLLESISQDGAILQHQGQRFLLPVQR